MTSKDYLLHFHLPRNTPFSGQNFWAGLNSIKQDLYHFDILSILHNITDDIHYSNVHTFS